MKFEEFLSEAAQRTPREMQMDKNGDASIKAEKASADSNAKSKGLSYVGGIYYADSKGQNLHKHPGGGKIEPVSGDANTRFERYVKKGDFDLTAHGKKHFGHLQGK